MLTEPARCAYLHLLFFIKLFQRVYFNTFIFYGQYSVLLQPCNDKMPKFYLDMQLTIFDDTCKYFLSQGNSCLCYTMINVCYSPELFFFFINLFSNFLFIIFFLHINPHSILTLDSTHNTTANTGDPLFIYLLQNTPNDLQLLSDAPAHRIFTLLAPITSPNELPEILCVVQVYFCMFHDKENDGCMKKFLNRWNSSCTK